MRNRIACAIVLVGLLLVSAASAAPSQCAADDLRGSVTNRRLPLVRLRRALQLRWFERARDADPQRRTGRRLRVGGAAQHAAPLQAEPRGEARHVHVQPPRAHRPAVEPRGDQVAVRPAAQAGQARDLRSGRAGRRIHEDGHQEDGAVVGSVEGRRPGARCSCGERARSRSARPTPDSSTSPTLGRSRSR